MIDRLCIDLPVVIVNTQTTSGHALEDFEKLWEFKRKEQSLDFV